MEEEDVVSVEMEESKSASIDRTEPFKEWPVNQEHVSLSWKDVTYVVPELEGNFIKTRTGKSRTLLNKVNGCVKPGECVALMGPSGSGKSTMLDVLTGRVKRGRSSGLTGQIMINGVEVKSSTMKRHVSYVMQDDALYGALTVRENLYFSANLRLPNTMTKKQKLERVEEVIAELGLTKCADTKIGNAFFRGVSGGERRRCSIGMELVVKTAVLLLDEPTSGLDAKSARMIVETLVRLARSGRTVVCTIHQPSSQVFRMFDKVMLLTKGEQAFFGPVSAAVTFFAQCDQPLPPMVNPADHFIEAINYDFVQAAEGGVPLKPPAVARIIDGYCESTFKQQLDACIELQSHLQEEEMVEKPGAIDDFEVEKYNTSMLHQLLYLSLRTFYTYLRDPGIFWARIVMYALMALVMGTLYLRMGSDQSTIQDRISVLFFSVAFLCFMAIAALPSFLSEREIFVRERRNAYYSVLPYALSHWLVAVPFIFAIAVSFACISYFMMGLHQSAECFFYFLLVLAVSLLCSEGMVVAISTVVPSFIVGIAAAAALFGMYMLLCGFFVRASNIPSYWIWFHYLVFHKYAFEGFMVNEFSGTEFDCYNATYTSSSNCTFGCVCLLPDLNGNCFVEGSEVLAEYEYDGVNKWAWLGVLAGMAIVYAVLFYLSLRFFNTGTR